MYIDKNKERNDKIWRLRQDGFTYSKIAQEVGLKAERVRQICNKYKWGGSIEGWREVAKQVRAIMEIEYKGANRL